MNALFGTTKGWKNPRCGGHFSEVKDGGRKLFCTRKGKQKWLVLLAVRVLPSECPYGATDQTSQTRQEDGAFQTSTVSLSHHQKPINELGKGAGVPHSFRRASVGLAG